MKTKKMKLKKVWTAITATAAMTLASQAFATDQSAQSQIGSQLSLTHDAIGQLLDRMQQSHSSGGTLDQADYDAKSQAFQARIASATADFEKYLSDPHKGLLIQAQVLMAKYNEIYESSQYSDDVKKSLLAQQKNYLDQFMLSLGNSYALEIEKLMSAGGLDVVAQIQNYSSYVARIGSNFPVFDNLIPAFLETDCYSQSCINGSAFDEVTYLSLVQSMFLKPIHFTLEGGADLTVTADTAISYTYKAQNDDRYYTGTSSVNLTQALSSLITSISSSESLPADYNSLPVSVSSDEFTKAAAARTKAAQQAEQQKEQEIKTHQQMIQDRASAFANLKAAILKSDDDLSGIEKLDNLIASVCEPHKEHPEYSDVQGCVNYFDYDEEFKTLLNASPHEIKGRTYTHRFTRLTAELQKYNKS